MAASPIPFVDTHVHFWDLSRTDLTYGWLQPGVPHPVLGDIEGLKQQRFDADLLWSEARFAGVEAFVHIQAAVGSPDPVAETRWLSAMSDAYGQPGALVAHADLIEPDVEQVLDEHGKSPLLRGVRDFAVEPALASGESQRLDGGLRALAKRGLLLDLDCEWPNMPAAAELVARHPELVVVLEHLGFPRRRDQEYFQGWQRGIATLAALPNVHCKISGIGMGDRRWTAQSIAPWVAYCVEAFGPARCVFGSNWPVDRLFSSYDAAIAGYRKAVAELSEAEQQQVLRTNAIALYRPILRPEGTA